MSKIELFSGLSNDGVTESRVSNGSNIMTPPPSEAWYDILLDKFKDPIIMILIMADIFSFIVNLVQGEPMWESLGILAAILITCGVGFFQDYSAKKQFESLNKVSDNDLITVKRNGVVTEVYKRELVVGDIVLLGTGDEIPADIRLIEAVNLHVNESSMTGESMPVTKSENVDESASPTYPMNLLLRSTLITEGSGFGEVVAVGDNTEIGKTARKAMEMTDEKTPLTIQLENLASKIGKASYIVAIVLMVLLNAVYFIKNPGVTDLDSIVAMEVDFIMEAVVVIIAMVPEGLSLAVVLALAYSVKTMMKDNNLVKKMKATETLGAVNIIFSDKTGTLTKNDMTVVDADLVNPELVYLNGSINSTANLDASDDSTIGNPTEGAILRWAKYKGTDYDRLRKTHDVRDQKPFNSTDKYMSTTIADFNSKPKRGKYTDLILVKGAPEVLANMVNDHGYLHEVAEQQARGRRAISFASGSSMDKLIYDGTVFIEDPVRDDVPDAVKECYNAGIDVVMMTGDNIVTASEIARQAGFNRKLQDDNKEKVWAIEAKDFNSTAWGDPHCGYPNVIARCKPEDKLNILKEFQKLHYVCGGTGDGTNDSAFLNHANVGIAMGNGTSVAKEASDIVLLDNSFPSIIKGIKWGRSLYKNIKSFLAFQLTVNLALCLSVLISPIVGIDSPFSIIEILYINLVMDALGALALASEPAIDSVMKDKPRNINEFIINKSMARFILSTGLSLTAIMVFFMASINDEVLDISKTSLFAFFMTFNWINLFRARVFDKGIGITEGLSKNKLFILVSLLILVMNVLIVQFGGSVFGTEPLTFTQWIVVAIWSAFCCLMSGYLSTFSKLFI